MSHTSALAQQILAKYIMAGNPHPPYSPDFAPCDFFPISNNEIEAERTPV
jgi:hypothetical protein